MQWIHQKSPLSIAIKHRRDEKIKRAVIQRDIFLAQLKGKRALEHTLLNTQLLALPFDSQHKQVLGKREL